MWTPPYCPDLQPIETFWGCGKNHVASRFVNGRSTQDTIRDLREGWYGTETMQKKYLKLGASGVHKKAVNCRKLELRSIRMANEKFIPLCEGIEGQIGGLIVDCNYQTGTIEYPIDLVVMNMAHEMDEIDLSDEL